MKITWKTTRDILFILVGGLVQALSLRLFLVPAQLVSGGVSGAAQIIHHFTDFPIGLMVFIGNVPLFILGWRFLGGRRFALRTALAIACFSFLTDILVFFLPEGGMTDDLLLNAIYGGVTLGVGLGLVYRGQGTSGGSDILGRILNRRLGISISQAYLITDTLVVLGGGLAFDWTRALYGLVTIYVSGLAAEMVAEGSGVFRSCMIITGEAQKVAAHILEEMERGVTILPAKGGYTGADREALYCVVTRPEVNQLRRVISEVDPRAFMVIGVVHEALGEGFRPLKEG